VRSLISWMAAEADRVPEKNAGVHLGRKPPQSVKRLAGKAVETAGLPAHQFPAKVSESRGSESRVSETQASPISTEETQSQVSPPTLAAESAARMGQPGAEQAPGYATPEVGPLVSVGEEFGEGAHRLDEYQRRIYRNRTVSMLRRYMRYSLETGKLPSLLGGEIFRAKVSGWRTFSIEDRIIFVHDVENCLERLDEFAQLLIARHILQEHDCENTARLLHCNEKTVRRLMPEALDRLSGLLLERGLMEALGASKKNSCQEGEEAEIELSDWEDEENKF